MKQLTWTLGILLLFPVSLAVAQEGANSADLDQTLQIIMQRLDSQEEQIEALQDQVSEQQAMIEQQSQIIETQKKVIDDQSEALAQQIQDFETQKQQMATTTEELRALPQQADSLSAEKAYEEAYEIYDTAIFDVPRRHQDPYFKRAAERFREVVENYPLSHYADAAQYRIALIYHRYLDDPTRAAQEWRNLLEDFPNSRYRSQAREGLRSLGESL